MSLDVILLGFLEAPATGYDLKKTFDETVRHFWNAELSQIYPALHRLRERGLVSVTEEPSPKGPDRKVYSRTAEGTAELRRWLATEPRVENQRIGFLAQLFFLGQAEEGRWTRAFLERVRAAFADRLAALRAIESSHRPRGKAFPPGLDRATAQPYLTLLFGMRRYEAAVSWCDECLELLDALEPDGKENPR